MNYNHIYKADVANGPGVRVSIFFQGCTIRCPGCFNSELWDFKGGKPFVWSNEGVKLLELLKPDYISGLTILGGEPLDQNLSELKIFINKIKRHYPNKTIWIYTGHIWEELSETQKDAIQNADMLVDGPFLKELKDSSLKWRGSSNQRIIDIKESLKENKIILFDE